MKLNSRQLATVLAALRYWQRHVHPTTTKTVQEAEIFGDLAPLDENEIDGLCEALNVGGPTPRVLVEISGGVCDTVACDDEQTVVYLVDWDNIKDRDSADGKPFDREDYQHPADSAGDIDSTLDEVEQYIDARNKKEGGA